MPENDKSVPTTTSGLPSAQTSSQPTVAGPGTPAGIAEGEAPRKPLSMPKKFMWAFLGLFSAFWIVFPEPTDVIPVLGWLDEGLAFVILLTSISKLFSVNIPIVTKLANKYLEKKTMGIVKPD